MSTPHSNPSDPPKRSDRGDDAARPPGFGWLTLGVLLIAILTLWLLTYPFNFHARTITSWLGEWGVANIHKINLASNLVLFMPLGCVWVWRRSLVRGGVDAGTLIAAALVCGIMSVIGETLQTRLPGRTSSAIDLLANIVGGGAGAAVGGFSAGAFGRAWTAAARWLGPRPGMQRCLIALALMLAVRTAPFDVSLETYYLRVKWEQETKLSVLPFPATRQWLGGTEASGGVGVDQRRVLALNELVSAGSAALLFLALAWCAGRAGGDLGATGCSWSAMALMVCLALVLATEAAQFFVRSRLMDATDISVASAAVVAGLLAELVTRPRHRLE